MKRDWYETAIWLPWLALPATALDYWRAWGRLPMRMAVHFSADGRASGWAGKNDSLLFAMGLIAAMLILSTTAAYIVRALKPCTSWPVLIAFYVALGFCWYGSDSIVRYNLRVSRGSYCPNCAALAR